MYKLLASACIFFAAWTSVTAAPIRERDYKLAPEGPPPIALDKIAKNAGAVYGNWLIWRYDDGGQSVMMINQKTNMLVYVTWQSNGWINYRTGGGVWHVLFPTGTPNLQNRADLDAARFLGKQPTHRLAEGKHTFQNWTVSVGPDAIEFFCPSITSRMIVRPSSATFVHNDRVIGVPDAGGKIP
jgi:hypothetical protein